MTNEKNVLHENLLTVDETTETEDKIIRTIPLYESYDYDKFDYIKGNRDVSTSQVDRIINSIQKFGVIENEFIQVASNFKIIDGQHRFAAKKKLGLPIIYTIITQKAINAMIACNTQVNWKEMDFVKCFAAYDNPNYQILLKLKNEFPEINTLRIYVQILTGDGTNGIKRGKKESVIRDGTLIIPPENYDKAVDTCKKIMDYKFLKNKAGNRVSSPWKHSIFYRTLILLINYKKYKHENVINRLKMYQNLFSKNISVEEYLKNITDIYNIGRSTSHKIYFTDILR